MGVKLIFAFLAAATSCHKHYYGTSYDLSTEGRVIAWPIDDEGKQFRYTIDHIPRPLREGVMYDLTVGHGPIRGELPEPVDSVLVVLPPEPEPGQRKGAERIVEWVVSHKFDAATHIVVGPEAWTHVRDLGRLEQALAKLEERTADRLKQFGNTFHDALMIQYLGSLLAGVVVVPVTDPKNRFVVVQMDYSEGKPATGALHTLSGAEAADYIVANYELPLSEMEGFVGDEVRFPAAIHILLAHDAPAETRAAASDLGQSLSGRRPASEPGVTFMVVYRTSKASQAELNARGAIKTLSNNGELFPFEAVQTPPAE